MASATEHPTRLSAQRKIAGSGLRDPADVDVTSASI
jgi:hypothetical protein